MSATLPWELNPVLQQDRLVALAKIVVETRNKVFTEASREEGDSNWGLACRAHERLGHALSRAADSDDHPWLTVHREGLYLMPLIEGVAIRVYRGTPDKPGSRHLDAVRGEYERSRPRQQEFFFMDGPAEEDPWFWLMALETDGEGRVLRAVFFQANESGETRNPWEVPLDGVVSGHPVAVGELREPREVPPPIVRVATGGARAQRGRRARVALAVQ